MAEGFKPILDYNEIIGMYNNPLQTDWDFQDEFTATNPITTLEEFPRCSSPIPRQYLSKNIYQPSYDEKIYQGFKMGLKRLPDFVKVRGVQKVPPYLINGNLAREDSMELYSDQMEEEYVQDDHRICQEKHSFNEQHELSPQPQSMHSYPLPYDKRELNESESPVLQPPNRSYRINKEDTPPFTEDAEWSKYDEFDAIKAFQWSYYKKIESMLNEILPASCKDNPSTGLPSRYSEVNVADLIHRIRLTLKDDYEKA